MAQQLPKGAAGKELQQALLSGEQVFAWAEGKQGSHLVATDRRVILVKIGVSSGSFFGRKVTVFPYTQLTSVDLHIGIVFCYALISTPGAQAATIIDINQQLLADNACAFPKHAEKAFRQVVGVIRARMQSVQITPAATPAAATAHAIPDQIAQLAHLRDHGILSPEEFEAKKADLLSRM